MQKSFLLVKWELRIQNCINELTKYQVMFFLFCTLSANLINTHTDAKKYGLILTVICFPISLIGFAILTIKRDIEDGHLELLLSSFTALEIVIAKFFGIYISNIMSVILVTPIAWLIFDLDQYTTICFFISLCALLALSSALTIVIATVQGYFRSNTSVAPTLIMPLLVPNIVMTGLILQDTSNNINLLFVMIGLDLILLPILLFFSAYLVKNVYNLA